MNELMRLIRTMRDGHIEESERMFLLLEFCKRGGNQLPSKAAA